MKLPKSAQEVLQKESGYQHYKTDGSVIKGKANEFGIAQIKRRTWNWFNELRDKQGLPKLYDILDPFQQVKMIDWAWKNGLQKHWSTYVPEPDSSS